MKLVLTILLSTVLLFGVVLLLAFPTMWAWNALMPDLFGLKEITFSQALIMNALCSVLLKSVSR